MCLIILKVTKYHSFSLSLENTVLEKLKRPPSRFRVNMVERDSEFSFLQGIHVRTDIRIDFSISIRPMTFKFGKQVHLGELT